MSKQDPNPGATEEKTDKLDQLKEMEWKKKKKALRILQTWVGTHF